jgi:hypothetical protein
MSIWTAILGFLQAALGVLSKFATLFREEKLREQGRQEVQQHQLEDRLNANQKASEIDSRPVPDDPADILSRM